MARVTIDQFAVKCCMERRALMVYIGRGKVIVEEGGIIDTNHEKNLLFYNKRDAKGLITTVNGQPAPAAAVKTAKAPKAAPVQRQVPRSETYVGPGGEDEEYAEKDDDDEILDLGESEKRKKHFDAVVSERNSELLRLKTEKLKGEVVPTEPISMLVYQFKQHTLSQQKIAYQSFLNEISQKYSITSEDQAYYRGFFIKALNNSVMDATESFTLSLESVLKQFSIKKGVGERG